jgi:hypothetical protein
MVHDLKKGPGEAQGKKDGDSDTLLCSRRETRAILNPTLPAA